MSSQIPVQNIYYLLAYAWDGRLESSDHEAINDQSCPDLEEFFAQVLTMRLVPLLRRGLDRSYLEHNELTSRPRGRVNFTSSAKRQTWINAKMHCDFDDLSTDNLHNRIVKATLLLLYKETAVSIKMRETLHTQLENFREVANIDVTPRMFCRVQLHRNNRSYRFILHLCELIHSCLLPEHNDEGSRKFRRIEEDENIMPYLFERFVLEFSKKHFPDAKCHRPHIQWLSETVDTDSLRLLPRMETDVTIEWPHRKLIVDCKYYRNAFTSQTFDETESKRFRTNNLYQIFAYLMNQRIKTGWEAVEGILLYPTTTHDFQHEFSLHGQLVQVASINLDQAWTDIESQLIGRLNGQQCRPNTLV